MEVLNFVPSGIIIIGKDEMNAGRLPENMGIRLDIHSGNELVKVGWLV